MKKLLALFLSIVMVLSMFAFAGCSKNKDKDSEKETEPQESTAIIDDTYEPSEIKNDKTFLNLIGDYVDNLKSSYKVGHYTNADITLTLSSKITDLLSETNDTDFSWLKNICADVSINQNNYNQETSITLGLNDVDLFTIEYIYDLVDTNAKYTRYPDLSKAYQMIKLDDYDGSLITIAITKALPDGDTVEKLIKKYTDIAIEQIKEIKKEDATVTADGISQDCIKYSFDLDNKGLNAIYTAILTEVKNDQEIKDFLKRVAEAMGENEDEITEGFEEYIDDVLEDLEEFDEENNVTVNVSVYLTDEGKFVGIELNSEEDDDAFSILMPQSDNKTGVNLSIYDSDISNYNISGQYQYTDSKLTGEFLIKSRNKDIGTFSFTHHYDPDQTTISSTMEFSFVKDFWSAVISTWQSEEYLPEEILEIIEDSLTIKSSTDSNPKGGKTELSIISDSEELAKITADVTSEEAKEITIPEKGYDMFDEDEAEEYQETVNTGKFALTIMTKLSKVGMSDEFLADLMG